MSSRHAAEARRSSFAATVVAAGLSATLPTRAQSFLPQLLRYPNPTDPLNGEAASLLMRHPDQYATKVKGSVDAWPAPKRRVRASAE